MTGDAASVESHGCSGWVHSSFPRAFQSNYKAHTWTTLTAVQYYKEKLLEKATPVLTYLGACTTLPTEEWYHMQFISLLGLPLKHSSIYCAAWQVDSTLYSLLAFIDLIMRNHSLVVPKTLKLSIHQFYGCKKNMGSQTTTLIDTGPRGKSTVKLIQKSYKEEKVIDYMTKTVAVKLP